MATKKSVQTVREELRELNSAATEAVGVDTKDWRTPEFWATAGTVIANVVAAAVLFGWVNSSDAETLTKTLTGLVSATSVILTNGAVIWKYIAARTSVKEHMIMAQFRYMEAVTIERMRSE